MTPAQRQARKRSKGQANQELINRMAEDIAGYLHNFADDDLRFEALSVMVSTENIKALYAAAGWNFIPTRGAKRRHEIAEVERLVSEP